MPKKGPIIIVEDESDDQDLLKELFEELNLKNVVMFFKEATDALDFLLSTNEKPFLILSDIYLPSMSGLEFLKTLRKHPLLSTRAIPFVFFTTDGNKTVIKQAYEFQAQGFFTKPLTGAQLKQSIGAIINYWKISRVPGS